MTQNQLLAAAIEVDITPPPGLNLDGYAARADKSVGTHDPLIGQILILETGAKKVMIICLDLVAVSLAFTSQLRMEIQQAIGIPPENILISCSHTHSSVSGFMPPHPGIPTSPNPELQQKVGKQLLAAITSAYDQRKPAQVGIGKGIVEGIGLNRNDPNAAVDNEVFILRVDTDSGDPLAVLMNYGCHPTVLGYSNLYYSADYPGAARANLRKIYPNTIFMYTNGASGDISTRFTRREQTFKEVERMGRILSGEVLKVMQTIATHPASILAASVAAIELKFRPFPEPETAQLELETLKKELQLLKDRGADHGEIRKATTRVEGAAGQLMMRKDLEGITSYASQMQVIIIDTLALVGIPGEPFTKTVLEIKSKSPLPNTAVISYANDYRGYFPDEDTIAQKSYEALVSPYGAETALMLRDTALELIHRSVNV
ncbi:MAG: hypothetical protein GYA34_07650 [Chloroflexi bacterium]|nr:hypothetical protein [Chloroflexota bacterium]